MVIHKGNNGELFFFNKQRQDNSNEDIEEDDHFYLCLQVINKVQDLTQGEMSRESSECCTTYQINPKSELFDFLVEGRISL